MADSDIRQSATTPSANPNEEIVENDVDFDEATVSPVLVEIPKESKNQEVTEMPIFSSHGLLGVLRIDWGAPRVISHEEMEIVNEVASQISIAIEQSRLREETRRHADELESMIRIRTTQLETANKEMEAFTYSVSHDLRAPLRAIDGFSRFIEEDYAKSLDSEGKRLLGVIRYNTVKMDKLITDLLNLSRITRGELRKSSINMEKLVKEVCTELETDAGESGCSVKVGRIPATDGDPSLLRQVWLNLVGNAIKYSSKSPIRRFEIGSVTEDGSQVYYIKDEGAGFEPEYASKLFTPFHRLHKSEEFDGTGIGLAIVQRIVARHGGWVRAESPGKGKGATFYFSIPGKESVGG
jgi:light-regulated signal transduction histidine kinase (bacteriophytochrome)